MGVLDGKVAVVTGASRGIGEFIARRFAQEGAAVAVSARTVEPEDHQLPGTIKDVVAKITAAGGKAVAIRADLANPDDRANLMKATVEQLGPVDILVSNAAVTYFVPVEEFADKRYRLMFEVQVRAPFELAQLAIPDMKKSGRGWILNISSGAARHPQGPPFRAGRGGGTVYGMCKAALERFSTGLASELYQHNISVNALSPSQVVPTPGTLFHRLVQNEDQGEPPEVMAEASLVLCSEDPQKVTGRIAYSQQILEEFGREAVRFPR